MHVNNFLSKIIFIKYLPSARPKLIPKLKILKIYWNLAHLISSTPISNVKDIFYEIFSPVRPKLALKLKIPRIYYNLAYLIFQIFGSRFWCQKWF